MSMRIALLTQAIQSLADPQNPAFCCRYYICLLSHINIDSAFIWENPIIRDAPYASDNLRLKLSSLAESMSLLDVVSAFLTTNRSREDMAALAHRMEHCDCDRTDRLIDSMHAWNWNYAAYCRDPSGFGLIAVIADIFFNALQLHEAQRTRWPQNRRRCLAGDDETAATMLCRWLDVYPVLPLLRAISAAAYSFGRLVLVPFLLSAHLPKNLVAILKRGVDSLPADFAGDFDPFGVVYPISLVFITTQELLKLDDGVSSAYFYREHCPLLLELLNRVVEIDEKMAWIADMNWEGGICLGGIVHAKLVLPFDETKYHKRILACSKGFRTSILTVQTPYQLARNIMLTLAELPPQCMDVSCTAATAPSMCSGCRRVAYCNAHGRDPYLTRKCAKVIRALADAAGFPIYTNPKTLPPQIEVDEFYRRVQDAVSLSAVNAFNENMIEDDRIRRVVNDISWNPLSSIAEHQCHSDDAECQQIRDFLVVPRKEAIDLAEQIAQTEKLLDELTRKHDDLTEFIDAHLALVSPARRLPDDVVREIFVGLTFSISDLRDQCRRTSPPHLCNIPVVEESSTFDASIVGIHPHRRPLEIIKPSEWLIQFTTG
ncbi:hypothetical protein C8J57DRAFT_1592336 [Mycena rebaudengoi]|nr:hypothetical protein C8J57DRAFT_1592336 [Mycena rebaudengoi]